MRQLILINGNGGAGKTTNSKLLYSQLENASWTHMRWLLALKRWQPTDHYTNLLISNASAVLNNYFEDGVDRAILSGGIFSQGDLDNLLDSLKFDCDVRYFWLEADADQRFKRVTSRARDDGDKPEAAKILINKYSYVAKPLQIQNGKYQLIDVATKSPLDIVGEIIESLK